MNDKHDKLGRFAKKTEAEIAGKLLGTNFPIEDVLKNMKIYEKPIKGASYINTDGTFIGNDKETYTHKELNNKANADFYNDYDLIGINHKIYGNTASIDIPEGKEINLEEQKALELFIDSLGKDKSVDFGFGPYLTNEYTGKEIVQEIIRKRRNK